MSSNEASSLGEDLNFDCSASFDCHKKKCVCVCLMDGLPERYRLSKNGPGGPQGQRAPGSLCLKWDFPSLESLITCFDLFFAPSPFRLDTDQNVLFNFVYFYNCDTHFLIYFIFYFLFLDKLWTKVLIDLLKIICVIVKMVVIGVGKSFCIFSVKSWYSDAGFKFSFWFLWLYLMGQL